MAHVEFIIGSARLTLIAFLDLNTLPAVLSLVGLRTPFVTYTWHVQTDIRTMEPDQTVISENQVKTYFPKGTCAR